MKLRHSKTGRSGSFWGLLVLGFLALVAGCERDNSVEIDRNREPETFLTQGPENSENPTNPTDLYYRAHLFWHGEDLDGTIAGYRFAIDDTAEASDWMWTTKTDSVFRFSAGAVGAREHLFLIRSVDNLGKQDPTPDTLRFESDTRARPTVRFVPEKMIVNDEPSLLETGDTVRVFSSITFAWTGSDEDGEVRSWESVFGAEQTPRQHERSDTTRTENGLPSGPHTLTLSAIDDAGARSTTPSSFKVHSNLGTVTRLLPDHFVAKLPRPWISGTDTLVVDEVFDESGTILDTIPSRAIIAASWTFEDPDTEVRRFNWVFGRSQGATDYPDTSAVSLESTANPNVGIYAVSARFLVRATDQFGQVERARDTLFIPVGFRPVCEFVTDDVGAVTGGTTKDFRFTREDLDSDPSLMRYEYQFLDFDSSPTVEDDPLPDDTLAVSRFFGHEDVSLGIKRLKIRGLDNSGSNYPSAWDTVTFTLVPAAIETPGEGQDAARRAVRPAWSR